MSSQVDRTDEDQGGNEQIPPSRMSPSDTPPSGADALLTARGRTETRNYAEMGFEDKRNGKPTEAWSVLRTLAENRSSTQVGVGPARSKLVKQIQQLRKKLGELHPAVGPSKSAAYGKHPSEIGLPAEF